MVRLRLAVLICLGMAPHFADGAAVQDRRPNVLLILADDLGWSDLGCFGGEIRTPNLDALAAGGLRLTQFYNSARCCPSRASLLTGLYPHQAGVGAMTADRGPAFPGYRGRLSDRCVTLAEVLKSARYATAMCGKWHVGDEVSPIDRGFDDFYGFNKGYGVDSFDPGMMIRLPSGRPQHQYADGKFFATDAIADHALEFLKDLRSRGRPWFLYVAFQTPHFPLQSLEADSSGYAGIYAAGWDRVREQRLVRQKKMGLVPEDIVLSPRSAIPKPEIARKMGSLTDDKHNPAWDSMGEERRADLARRMATFAGMVTGMDRNIGRIISDLGANGEIENTLILFLSDNGACAEWEPFGFDLDPSPAKAPGTGINMGTQSATNVLRRGDSLREIGRPGSLISYGSGWANASNTPFRLYKHYCHEGGIRSPFIAHWPRVISDPGSLRHQPAHLVDVMPTLVEASGATYPGTMARQGIPPMEGVSLLPILRGQSIRRASPLFFEHERSRAVRDGKWKLVSGPDGQWELYDLDADPAEMHSVAGQMPDRVGTMSAQWLAWAQRAQVLPMIGDKAGKPAAAAIPK